jgi:predicted nuclease of predicted toxin-antitoxin system
MRLLVDENLSPRICDHLNAAGHEATHVCDEGMSSATDSQVLVKAVADGRVLLTADRGDFGRELAYTQATQPSVILLRQLPDIVRAEDVAALVLANLTPELTLAFTKGAFVVLAPNVVRVRYLPLR